MKKVLICGPGNIAGKHVKCIRNIGGIEVTGVCGRTIEGAKSFIHNKGLNAKAFDNMQEAVNADNYDYCVIATPRTQRKEQIKACVSKNIPMLIEKPPCSTIEEGREIEKILEKSKVIHSVGFMHRWSESINYFLDRTKDEKILIINIKFYNTFSHQLDKISQETFTPFCVSKSGGMIGDQCIHYFDLARYITKSEAKKVQGIYKTNQGIPVVDEDTTVDTLMLTLEMENKTLLTHTHSWSSPSFLVSMDIMTDKSLGTFDIFSNKSWGTIRGERFDFVGEVDEYEIQHIGLLNAIENNDQSLVHSTYKDALKTFELTEKILNL